MYSFNIILTEICNANCTHCYMNVKSNKKKKTLDEEKVKIILNKMPKNVKKIVLTGGEIFLIKDFLYFVIRKIKAKFENIYLELESNGKYFYDMDNPSVELEKLKKLGVDSIRFSDDYFHSMGGINLEKVRNLKKYENNLTPQIKYLVQDKVVPIGKASELSNEYISKANCMNSSSSRENPYLFLDIDGNIYTCAWKCVPKIGNIFSDAWEKVEENLKEEINDKILTGNIEEVVSSLTNSSIEKIREECHEKGQCALCIKYLKQG